MKLTRLLLLVLFLASCGTYRPALFADRPTVEKVDDERPIPIPSRDRFDERVYLSDVYLRRPLFDFVAPVEFATGGDVNALDEVPPSSWFDPEQDKQVAKPGDPQGPEFPLSALDEPPRTNDDALVVRDARGFRYELLVDPPEHPGLYTGAEALGGVLLRSLGLRAPQTWLVEVPEAVVILDTVKANARRKRWLERTTTVHEGRRHVSATQWPPGVDIGVTPDFSRRSDDANDRVDHHNRRTQRALKIFAHWMGWSAFDVESMRDVYVGAAGEGHLLHYVVGTSSAFGTRDLQARPKIDEEAGSEWLHFITLGLSKPVVRPARVSPYPSLGFLPERLTPGNFDLSPPYSPFVRLTPPDEY